MTNLSKSQRKELLRSREHAAQVAAELQRERVVGADLSWRGIGERVLQISEISAFATGFVWDVRRVADEVTLYVNELNPDKPGFLYPGYTRIEIEPEYLRSLLSSLASVKVVSWLPDDANIGLDGTTTTVEFQRGFSSAVFSWWQQGPPEWAELTQMVQQTINEFKLLSNSTVRQAHGDKP